jgi:hypothetical protein
MRRRPRGIAGAAAWTAAFLGLAALLTGCEGSSDSTSGAAAPSAPAPASSGSATDGGNFRNPTSAELDYTWFPDGDTTLSPLGIRHGEAILPTVNQCDGSVTFGAEVNISFPCGTDRAQGTLRINESGDKIKISWAGGITDTFVKRADLTVPDPTITGTPDADDLQRQVDELEDMVDDLEGLGG